MTSDWSDRLPDGMSFRGRDADNMSFSLSLPTDEDGFLPLHCPTNNEHPFKLRPDRDEKGEPDLPEALWCPYCGHTSDDAWEYMPEQREYAQEAMRAAAEQWMHQEVAQIMRKTFRGSSRGTSGGFGISIGYQPGRRPPVRQLPPMAVMETRRTLTCQQCRREYAVYGVTAFCPGCGRLGSLQEFDERALQHRARLDTLRNLPTDQRESYAEAGVLASVYESTIKDAFTSLEVLLKATFQQRAAPSAPATPRGAFQRLADAADLYRSHLGIDLPGSIGAEWDALLELVQVRHVLTHNAGIVDQAYLDRVPTSTLALGSRLVVSNSQAEDALRLVQRVAASLR